MLKFAFNSFNSPTWILEECNPELVNSNVKKSIVKIILDTKVTMLVTVVRF